MTSHILRVTHDRESHEIDDCHDDCRAQVICPGVTSSCRVWWECDTCRDTRAGMTDEQIDDHDDQLYEGEAHGVEHQRIDGMWMTPGTTCVTSALDHNGEDYVADLTAGDHDIDIDCNEGFVDVFVIKPT